MKKAGVKILSNNEWQIENELVLKEGNVITLEPQSGFRGQTLILEKIQENSIKSFLQNSLPYILLQMVCANYCAPYSK